MKINEQIALDPRVHAAPPRDCIGGPCDGLRYRVPDGYVLILARVTDEETNAVALPPHMIDMSQQLGTYDGHYVIDGACLRFMMDDSARGAER